MSRNEFLTSITVLDTETTNLHAEKAEVVEIAGARYRDDNWHVESMLLGAKDGIPPEASAKNHISNRMIAGKPTFAQSLPGVTRMLGVGSSQYLVAHNCRYDQDVLTKAYRECNEHDLALMTSQRDHWICTHRLSKHLLEMVDFPDMQYNLSYLRYRLDLPVSDDLPAHRASADTLTCAILFEFLVDYAIATGLVRDDKHLGRSLHEVCWRPFRITTWPFGKNRGRPLAEIETDYYLWACQNMDALNEDKPGYDPDLAASVAAELERRMD